MCSSSMRTTTIAREGISDFCRATRKSLPWKRGCTSSRRYAMFPRHRATRFRSDTCATCFRSTAETSKPSSHHFRMSRKTRWKGSGPDAAAHGHGSPHSHLRISASRLLQPILRRLILMPTDSGPSGHCAPRFLRGTVRTRRIFHS